MPCKFAGMKHKCDFPGCDYGAVGPGKLQEHKNKHLGIRNNVCHICGKTFTYRKHLQRHEKTHYPQKMLHCPLCDYKNIRSDKLRAHVRTHHKQYAIDNGYVKPENVEKLLKMPEVRRVPREPRDPSAAPPKNKRPKKKKAKKERVSPMPGESASEVQEAVQWVLQQDVERAVSESPEWTSRMQPTANTSTVDMNVLQPTWYSLQPVGHAQHQSHALTPRQPQLAEIQVPVAIYTEEIAHCLATYGMEQAPTTHGQMRKYPN